jgi:hypothetical protein
MSPLDAEAPASETPPVPTQPVVFVEVKDAGERIDGALSIVANLVQPLTAIAGSLSGDADIFQIFISGDQPFSATTLSRETLLELPIDNTLGIPTDLLEDPQLFLFDALGNAVYGNDDLFGSSQATLPSRAGLLTPGIYYLAISGFDYDPVSAQGEIFPDTSFDGVLFPTEPGGGLPLGGFAGDDPPSGNYVIALTGATTVPPAAPPVDATLLALTDANQLISFSTRTPTQTTTLAVTGLEGTLIGIDVRPANGLIYGLTTTNQLYTLVLKDDRAEATLVGSLSQPFEGGALSGFDFNPVADRLRLVGENDQNFRINVDTGEVFVDSDLAFAADDFNAGANPRVTGAAYTNSLAGSTMTQLFNLDSSLDSLVLQNPPNDGTLQTVGKLGVDLGTLGGFEIVASAPDVNTAFVVSNGALYTLNLQTGISTSLGAIGSGEAVTVQGLTAVPAPAAVTPLPELVDLTGFDGNITLNVTLAREAGFNNLLRFYETDALGRIDGLLPGDAGYEAAAAANLVDGIALTVANNQSTDVSLTLAGGTYYAPALLINGSAQNLATVGDAALGQARIKREGNTLLFEDLTDFDFNDLVVTFAPDAIA